MATLNQKNSLYSFKNADKRQGHHTQGVLDESIEDILQVSQFDSPETKCEKIMEINYNLSYNISLLEAELQTLKKMQHQKTLQNTKIKQKAKRALQKQQDLKRHLKLQQTKVKKLTNGFKLLTQQTEQMKKKEEDIREKRIDAQQNKIKVYELYNQEELKYRELIVQIKERDGVLEAVEEEYAKNEELQNEIDQIGGCLKQQKSFRDNAQALRRQRNNKVRQLNERVLALQRQQSSLTTQIAQIERNQQIWQNERQKIQQKSAEAVRMYQQVQQTKNSLISKKVQFSELDSTYKQFCIEQNRLKKQILLKNQCEQETKKYKEALKKKPLQTSKVEDNRMSPVLKPVPALEPGVTVTREYDSLRRRYEKLSKRE